MKIIGVTPARGGSKEVPGKNTKEICGKPLIAWTIEAALKSKSLDEYFVLTEDKKISEIAEKYGTRVVEEPASLAQDNITILPVLQDFLKTIKAEDDDIVVLLMATSPVRDEGLIDQCVKTFLEKKADSLATGFICDLLEWGTYNEPRQQLKGYFHDDGNVYVHKVGLLRKGDPCGKKMEKVAISREQNFEIDDEFDFWLNEKILEKRQ